MNSARHASYQQNRNIQAFISNHPSMKVMNYYITVTFARGVYGPMRRKHAEDARRMVQAYAHKLSHHCFGRSRKTNSKKVPFIAWPEDRTKTGETCPLHYHILCQFPPERHDELVATTEKYWSRAGNKSHHKIQPSIDIREAYNPFGCSNYNMKNTADMFTVEYMVIHGFGSN